MYVNIVPFFIGDIPNSGKDFFVESIYFLGVRYIIYHANIVCASTVDVYMRNGRTQTVKYVEPVHQLNSLRLVSDQVM